MEPSVKGQLPKAYLRLDPLIDSHPDWPAMVALILWANRQLRRGYFRSLENIKKAIGKKRLQACIDRQDLVQLPDGSYHLVGWEEWQEGDHTVGERVRRCRDRRSIAVTSPLLDSKPPSEALGVKASGVEERIEQALVLSGSDKAPNGNGLTDEQKAEYASAVWEEFLKVSGQRGTRSITPLEYAALKRWMDAGIPLRVVLRGMADTKGKGRMLGYYNSSVQDAYEYHRQATA